MLHIHCRYKMSQMLYERSFRSISFILLLLSNIYIYIYIKYVHSGNKLAAFEFF
ncbi:hypothetical protein Patl1_34810 [Pistacia atlantica]|uniref:Uncharacterized protein n=1 Tax=Pistacia atlantica TaxID=434234 RepID=A0ACC0ZWB7_9ROSI|nr:hypothetical protein Patl1_34810 [Pistacia atlantica]